MKATEPSEPPSVKIATSLMPKEDVDQLGAFLRAAPEVADAELKQEEQEETERDLEDTGFISTTAHQIHLVTTVVVVPALAYTGKKAVDMLADLVKEWLLHRANHSHCRHRSVRI